MSIPEAAPNFDLTVGLNEAQRRAIEPDGVSLVFAGAGSGKTRTLTHKLAKVLLDGHPAREVVALTFTNKAAAEMRERVRHLLQQAGMKLPTAKLIDRDGLFVGTFHAWGARFLRREIKPDLLIYDEEDALAVIKDILKRTDWGIDPRFVRHSISFAKNRLLSREAFASSEQQLEQQVAELWRLYEEALHEQHAFDFDDLIVKPLELLERDAGLRQRYQYRYLLIDEFQDTNLPQYRLISLLVQQHGNLFVVGDDYQAIYGFRGTNYKHILELEQDFPTLKTFILAQNYRSTNKILGAANQLIRHNQLQKHKDLWTENSAGEDIALYECSDGDAEAILVTSMIADLIRGGCPAAEIAVLYRINSLSRALEEQLIVKRIPYRIYGGLHFYQRREVKDILAYLRVIANPRDLISLKRIINVPTRGIGPKAQETILTQPAEAIGAWLMGTAPTEGVFTGGKRFHERYTYLQKYLTEQPTLSEFVKEVVSATSYLETIRDDFERVQNVSELVNVASSFDELPLVDALREFLDLATLWQAHDEDKEGDRIKLMSIHLSKGLEFRHVFIIGMEEELFPHHKSVLEGEGGLEEERRMAYVALTRARERLYLSYARRRRSWGRYHDTVPSRFLRELPLDHIEFLSLVPSYDGGTRFDW